MNYKEAQRSVAALAAVGIYDYFCEHDDGIIVVQADPNTEELPLCPECGRVAMPALQDS